MRNNVITLFPAESAAFDYAAVNRRAAERFRAAERRRERINLVETAVTVLIGAGFAVCIALTLTML